MTDSERLDICTAMYGGLKKAFGKFYWTLDKRSLVNVVTGEDLLAGIEYSYGERNFINYVNRKIVKVGKAGVVYVKDDITNIYGIEGNVIARIKKKNVEASYVKEYLAKGSNRAFYRIGLPRGSMTVCVIDTQKQEMETTHLNVLQIYETEDEIKLSLYENGKINMLTYKR